MLSRIAESMFWIGRYVERAEDTARILDVQTQLILEDPAVDEAATCRSLLSIMGVEVDRPVDVDELLELLAYDRQSPASIAATLAAARESARRARETLSTSMWEGINDRVTDTVFRMEEAEGFQESIWAIGATIHESAPRITAQDTSQQGVAAGGEAKKQEPIRNRKEKVGRNDPCPCGSGKKYKNCHMRQVGV